MIPYDIDPSLHTAEPEPAVLGDGFSPPPHNDNDPAAAAEASAATAETPVDPALWAKSAF